MHDQEFLQIFLEESEDLLNQWQTSCLNMDQSFDVEDLNCLFRAAHTLKGSSKAVGLDDFGDFIHQVEDIIRALQENEISPSDATTTLLAWHQVAEGWLEAIQEGDPFDFDESTFQEQLAALKGEKVAMPKKDAASKAPPSEAKAKGSKSKKKDSTIRVPSSKCDKIIRSVGQITTNCTALRKVLEGSNPDFNVVFEFMNALEKHTDVLHRDTLAIRMQPLDRFFVRMQALARDVSQQTGKPIKIQVEGNTVEIDKAVGEKLIDPFIHIVRNAIDHGLETPEGRRKAGKTDEGLVRLKARSTSGGVEISVRDDGKGIDPDIIFNKAVEKGIISAEEDLTEEQIYQLILRPGFSTKEQVSDLSGRGVGMDVVASTLVELGGRIQIQSQLGEGTAFVLSIPADLSILDAFIVESGTDRYCVLLQEVDEIIDLKVTGTRNVDKTEMVVLPDGMAPIKNIHSVAGRKPKTRKDAEKRPAFVTRYHNQPTAFEVDRIVGQQKIMVSENEGAKKVYGFSGVAILDDFHPGMILSLSQLASEYHVHSKEGVA